MLSIEPATEVEAQARDQINHSAWGGLMNIPEWIEFGRFLRQDVPHYTAKNVTWILVKNEGTQDAPRKALASCETHEFECHFQVGEKLDVGKCYGIASVFVAEEDRGHGYAEKMLTLLIQHLLEQDKHHLYAMFLNSQIGSKLYERLGFVSVNNNIEWLFPAQNRPTNDDSLASNASSKFLSVESVKSMYSSGFFATTPAASGQNEFQVKYTVEWLEAFWVRQKCFLASSSWNKPPVSNPNAVGVISGNSFILWHADIPSNVLQVIMIRFDDQKTAHHLIKEAQYAAAEHGLPAVNVWEDERQSSHWHYFEGMGERRSRGDHALTMIKPLHPKLQAQDWKHIPFTLYL